MVHDNESTAPHSSAVNVVVVHFYTPADGHMVETWRDSCLITSLVC
jgi:hypothetical protein